MNKKSVDSNLAMMQLAALEALGQGWHLAFLSISHALINQLAILRLKQNLLKEMLPLLLQAYHVATQHNLIKPSINSHSLQAIDEISNATEQINTMLIVLEGLNARCKTNFPVVHPRRDISISTCLHTVLNELTLFKNEQLALINVEINEDFLIPYPEDMIQSLLMVLITEALPTNKITEKDNKISFWTTRNNHYFHLHCQYRNLSLDQHDGQYWCNQFFSVAGHEVKWELGFYRLALLQLGGEITCDISQSKQMHFTIHFPINTSRISS